MIESGMSHSYILSGLINLFLNIYAKNVYLNVNQEFPIINKILLRNIELYSSKYTSNECLDILRELHKIDKMIKTFQYGIDYTFELLILNACNERRH